LTCWRLQRPEEYFDKIAAKYAEITSRGILGAMRKKERECVMQMLSPQPRETVLDAGCGAGFYSSSIKECGAEVLGVDISPKMVEAAIKSGIKAEVRDLKTLNLGRKFNKIVCAGVLEFCEEPQRVIENLKNHLNEHGFIVFLIPSLSLCGLAYKLYHLSHGVHVTLFSLGRFEKSLNKSGLKIVAIENPTPFTYVLKAEPIARQV